MANVGRTVPNTISKAPITFAMIELADTPDCNARKGQWLRYGFKDVTPLFGSRSSVPSLNDSMVDQGRQMLKAMAYVVADWYMVSGHHGCIYADDYNRYTTDGKPWDSDHHNLDVNKLYDEEPYCGFFNEAYHKTYWDYGTRDYHTPKSNSSSSSLIAKSIYLRTTDAAPANIGPTDEDNPVFDSTSWAPEPKGFILSACNTLSYKAARKTWSTYFPNAVFIGTTSWIVSGTWVSTAVASAAMTNESFWRNPQSILDQAGMPEQLEKQLTANFPSSSEISVLYKGNLYRPSGPEAAY